MPALYLSRRRGGRRARHQGGSPARRPAVPADTPLADHAGAAGQALAAGGTAERTAAHVGVAVPPSGATPDAAATAGTAGAAPPAAASAVTGPFLLGSGVSLAVAGSLAARTTAPPPTHRPKYAWMSSPQPRAGSDLLPNFVCAVRRLVPVALSLAAVCRPFPSSPHRTRSWSWGHTAMCRPPLCRHVPPHRRLRPRCWHQRIVRRRRCSSHCHRRRWACPRAEESTRRGCGMWRTRARLSRQPSSR